MLAESIFTSKELLFSAKPALIATSQNIA